MAVAVFTFVDQRLLKDPHPRLARVVGGALEAERRVLGHARHLRVRKQVHHVASVEGEQAGREKEAVAFLVHR